MDKYNVLGSHTEYPTAKKVKGTSPQVTTWLSPTSTRQGKDTDTKKTTKTYLLCALIHGGFIHRPP